MKYCAIGIGPLLVASLALGQPLASEQHYANALLIPADAQVRPELINGPVGPAPRGDTTPCRTVFGYLPYWESSANIRWDHLTHLAAFSIGVNSRGDITDTRGWPWTSTVNTAHANGVEVVIVITLFDSNSLLTLLESNQNKQRLFANIYNQIVAGNADGVNLDFEGSASNGWAALMPAFLTELRAYLDARRPGMHISIAAPAVNWSSNWPLSDVADACDVVFIMGYNYYGSWSNTSGPTAPLTGGSINVTDTIDRQYAGVDRSKIVLGLPFYGNQWETADAGAYSSATSWINHPRVRDDQSNIHGLLWDNVSQTPWYRWQSGGSWRQVWMDNETSIALKWDLVESRGLQGGGMWALNYDGTELGYWNVIQEKFIEDCAPCAAERTGDEMIDVFDLLAYLDDWFPQNAAAEMTGDSPESIDVFDLLAYLDVWFAGC